MPHTRILLIMLLSAIRAQASPPPDTPAVLHSLQQYPHWQRQWEPWCTLGVEASPPLSDLQDYLKRHGSPTSSQCKPHRQGWYCMLAWSHTWSGATLQTGLDFLLDHQQRLIPGSLRCTADGVPRKLPDGTTQ